MTGGMVSFGPPLGGVVVFAHECEKIILPNIIAIGMAGRIPDIILFISIQLNICPYDTLYSLDLLEFPYKLVEVTHVMDIKVNITVKDSIFSAQAELLDVYAENE
jgi:hypothetical protein